MKPELPRWQRALALLIAFGALGAASPGVLHRSAVWPLALVGVALWARYASARGRWAAAIDFLAGGLGGCALMSWAAYVHVSSLGFIGVGFGLYFAAQGWALRRLAARLPLALAAPLAWMLFETLRAVLEPPFGIQWMRLGTFFHDVAAFRGAARLFGIGGLSWVLAALAGGLADLLARYRPVPGGGPKAPVLRLAIAALAPASIAVVAALATSAPQTVAGPRILLVQPAVPQSRKMARQNDDEIEQQQLEMTARSFAEAAAAGEPLPDLVAWGESMHRSWVLGDEVRSTPEARWPTWRDYPWPADAVRVLDGNETYWIQEKLLGGGRMRGNGAAPPGTAFVSGVEYLTAVDGVLRIKNSVVLWPGIGQPRRGPATKTHLVPGAETMLGLERFEGVRETILSLAGYVPDLAPAGDDDPVLSFEARDGRTYRFGASVCFDNAFDDVFTGPVRVADVDFHAVFSNEAWFELSQEADQMMAFSQLEAVATGRAVVRATQSGISAVIDPDGIVIARLEVDGEDKMVAGTLRATVPVPAGGSRSPFEVEPGNTERRPLTPFVRFERLWAGLWLAAPLFALLAGRRRTAAA